MITLVRTIIDLPAEQLEQLEAICKRERISRAEAIRQAVALLVRQKRGAAGSAAFGLWRGRKETGLEYQERVRSEWDERSGPDGYR